MIKNKGFLLLLLLACTCYSVRVSVRKILAWLWYQINFRKPPKLICILLYETPWGYCAFHVLSTSTLLDLLVFTFPTRIIVPFDFATTFTSLYSPPMLLSYLQHFSSYLFSLLLFPIHPSIPLSFWVSSYHGRDSFTKWH